MNRTRIAAMIGMVAAAGMAQSQNGNFYEADSRRGSIFISEVWNDPQDGDGDREYIEIWSDTPNQTLNGMMLVVLSSRDDDDDDTNGIDFTEVDESYIFPEYDSEGTIPLYQTNCDGLFVLWNSDDDRNVADPD